MVIAVLAGMLALAVPFAFSMFQQGRQSRSDLHALHAREGADAAVAHALAQLHKTLRYDPADTSPEVTTPAMLKINMDFPGADEGFRKFGIEPALQNPNGLLWSARVEDEQGKINLNTAPPVLIGNLLGSAILLETAERGAGFLQVDEPKQFYSDNNPSTVDGYVCVGGDILRYKHVQGAVVALAEPTSQQHLKGALVFDGRARLIADYKFKNGGAVFSPFRSIFEIKAAVGTGPGQSITPDEFARVERHLTTTSGMSTPQWGHAARPSEQAFNGSLQGFNIEKGEGFTPGALIRVVQNGVPIRCSRVRNVAAKADGSAFVALDEPIGVSASGSGLGNDLYIQPELKHPININTASPEVLEACFMGICMNAGNQAVTRAAAANLTDFIIRSRIVFPDRETFRKTMDQAYNMGILTVQQRDAIVINATEPNSPKLRTSTVPFCFFSFGSYTIEGSGVSNSDSGMQLSRQTVRQLVTLPTPWPGRYMVQHQAGFQALLDQGLASRVVTFPVPMGKYKYRKNAPTQNVASPNFGDVRLDVGESAPQGLPNEWIEHCEDSSDAGYRQDGYDLGKRNTGFKLPPVQVRGRNTLATQPGSVEMWFKTRSAGQCTFYEEGLEEERNRLTFVYEPSDGLVVRIYDAGLECMDGGNANFTHLKRKPVEFIYPVRLDANEWYHVGASWKSSHVNGQEIRLDAQPAPRGEQIKFKPGARLENDIALDEKDSLSLEEADSDDFPTAGAVKIGEEIIEYKKRQGNTLTELTRGSRLSAAVEHKGGEWVVPYGYTNNLAQDLPIGGATLVEYIDAASKTRTVVDMPPTASPQWVLDTDTKKIPARDTSGFPPSGLIVVNGECIYYGKRTATAFEQLQRAQGSRGVSAPARNLHNNRPITLASLQVTAIAEYDTDGIVQIDDENDATKVEWIRYGDTQTIDGKHYLVAHLQYNSARTYTTGTPETSNNGRSLEFSGAHRGYLGTSAETPHSKKAKVIPVVRMQGPHCGNQASPCGDNGVSTVSVLTRGSLDGELRYVKRAYINQHANWRFTGPNGNCPAQFTNWGFDFFIGLDDFVTRRYPANQTRMLKWPSGELPDAVGAQRYICNDRNGGGLIGGIVDELKVNTHTSETARIAMTTSGQGIGAEADEIMLEDADSWPVNRSGGNTSLNWPANGGLIRIEDELIWFQSSSSATIDFYADVFAPLAQNQVLGPGKADRSWRNVCPPNTVEPHPNIHTKTVTRISRLKRGVLGTKAESHPVGANVMLLDAMPISCLRNGISGNSDSFAVANGAGFPEEGYVLIGNEAYGGEAISYQDGRNGTFSGCRPFRGKFGTASADHEPGDLVRCLPFRYWDREAHNYDGPGLAYIQSGYSAGDAIWDSVEIITKGTEDQPEPNVVRPRVLARFDGIPNWDVDPVNSDGGLFEFRNKTGILPLRGNAQGGGVRANQIELRVYWEFKSGAFQPNSGWKKTFAVEKLRATYRSPLIMRRLDEVEKR